MPKGVPRKRPSPKAAVAPTLDNPFSTYSEYKDPGTFILIHGNPGEGKTTVAAHAPKPLFIHTADEQGIKQALKAGTVPADVKDYLVELDSVSAPGEIPDEGHPGWIKLLEVLKVFKEGNHDRRSIIIDTVSGVQNLCHQHCASMLFGSDMTDPAGFMNYYAGYIKAAEQFWQGQLLTLLSDIVADGYNVILLAHTKSDTEPNPYGPDFQMYIPDLDKRIWNYTKKAVQGIFYMGQERTVAVDQGKAKATSSQGIIGVRATTWYSAKNWFDLRDPIDVGDSAKATWDLLNAQVKIV